MSNTIDEKVVEMRFDNRDFEKNIKDTMKTLEEFKKQLNFSGASDGLENLNQYANKMNFNNLGKAIDLVNERFSALGIMGVTALQNITNSAINAGKRMIDSLTIAPVRSGYEEYELTLNTIKTVMNATNKSAQEVKQQLKLLDDYADKTIYSTADMFKNISKFTNVGVPLEDATTAMIGIANATAVAGQGADKAAIAMYNLGQAIGVGYLNRIDYKSIQNASIDTDEWKRAMIDAAIAAGTLTEAQDGMYKSGDKLFTMQNLFIDGLQTQWATRDVLMKVLTDYGNAETDIGKKAWKAAQEVRTFSGMMEALKASVGTGWKDTWELIFGDIDKATNFWTRINDFVSGIISSFTKRRNDFLKGVLDPINPLLEKIGKSAEAVKETVEAVKDYVNIVDDIIAGKWGNGQSRWDKLTAAGYDWAYAQNLVNERLGSSVRHATDFSESQKQIINSEQEVIDTTGEYIQKLSEMDDATMLSVLGDQEKVDAVREIQRQANRLGLSVSELVDRSDELSGRTLIIESLANIGNSLVKIFKSIGEAWVSAFPPITVDTVYDIVAGLYKFSNIIKNYVEENAENLTRTLKGLFAVLSVIANIVKGVLRVGFTAFKAIMAVFGKTTSGVLSVTASLGDVLVFISNILNKYIIGAFDIIIDLMEFVINAIKELITNNELLVNAFNWVKDGIYGTITSIKDYLVNNENLSKAIAFVKSNITSLVDKIKDWFKNTDIINVTIKTLNENVTKVVNGIKDWIKNNETIQNTFNNIKESIDKAKTSLYEWFRSFDEEGGIGKHIIDGLGNGLKYGISKIIEIIIYIANKIKETFCKLFHIDSPSKTFFEYGQYIIEGLLNGLKSMFPKLIEIFNNIYEAIKNVSFEKISAILWPIASIIPQLGFLNLPRNFANLFNACGIASLEGLKEGIESNGGVIATIKMLAQKIISVFKGEIKSNSPSKVFIAIGGFIMAGLLIGLKQGFIPIPDAIKGFAQGIIGIFENIDFGKVLAASTVIGSFIVIKQALKIFKSFADLATRITAPLKGLGDALSGFGKMFQAKGKAAIIAARGNVIKSIAESILMIAAAMFIISKIDNLGKAALTVSIIAGIMVGLYALLSYMSKNMTKSQRFVNNLNTFTNFLMAFSGCMIILSIAMKIMGKMKPEEITTGIIVMTGLMVIVGTLIAVTSMAGRHADKAATFISKIGVAFLMLATAMKVLGKLTPSEMEIGIASLTAFMVIVGALIAITKMNGGKTADKSAKVITKIGGAFLALSIAMRILAKLTPEEMVKGISILTGFMIIVGTLMAVTKLAGKNAEKAGKMILSISTAFVLLAVAMKILGNLTVKEMVKGGIVIAAFTGLVAILIKLSQYSGEHAQKAGLMILEVSAAFFLLALCLETISRMEWKAIGKGMVVLAGFTILVSALIGLSKFAGEHAQKAGLMILEISGAITALTICLVILAALDKDKLMDATKSLVAIILSFGAALFLMSKMKESIGKAIPSIIALGGVIALLGAIFGILEHFNLTPSLETVGSISLLLLAMSTSLLILSKVESVSSDSLKALAILGLVIGELAIIFGLMQHFNVQPSIETATALSIMLLAMSECLAILSVVGETKGAAINGALQLVAVIGIIGVAIGAIGALVNNNKEIEEFINKGGKILSSIGLIIGEFVGNLFAGFNSGLANSLPEITKKISESMDNLKGFISIANTVKGDTVKGVGYLAAAIIALTAAEFISGILALSPNIIGMTKLGFGLTTFIGASWPFFSAVEKLKPETLEGTKNLAEAILAITKAEFIQGINNFLGFGDKSLSVFGEQLGELGSGLNNFVAQLSNFDEGKVKIVGAACEAIKTLAEANKSIPNSGGLLANIVGDNTLDTFGNSLVALGSGINSFVTQLTNFDSKSANIVTQACEAIKTIAETNNTIPNSGGLIANIIGDNDLGDFGEDIKSLGTGLGSFVKALNDNGFSIENGPALIGAACEAIKNIAGLNKELENNDWYSKLLGKTDLEKFSEQIPNLATGIANFIKNLGGFKVEQIPLVQAATEALYTLATLGLLDLENAATNITYFGTSLGYLGTDIATFVNTLTNIGLETIQEGVTKVQELINMASTIAAVNIEQINIFSDSLIKVANDGVMGFCEAFSGVVPKEKAKQAVIAMMVSAIFGAESKRIPMINKFKQICQESIDTIRSFYKAMYDAGVYFVQGFADGINGNAPAAITAAYNMAANSVTAAQKAIDSASPSKETHKLGNYFGEGFVIGIKDYFGKVYDTAYNSGDLAKDGLSNAITKISAMIENGIDTSPTIRPVLDLSNVKDGAAYLGSMFGSNSIGVNENLNSISNGFNSRIQNGGSLDLLNAINKLEATVRGSNGNTLNIYSQELDSEKLDQIVRYVNKELGVIF